jgi:hypothetical protein
VLLEDLVLDPEQKGTPWLATKRKGITWESFMSEKKDLNGTGQSSKQGPNRSVRPETPVEEPPNAPQKPPVKEPGKSPNTPPPPKNPPVEEPPHRPPKPPMEEPPPEDPNRAPPLPPIRKAGRSV